MEKNTDAALIPANIFNVLNWIFFISYVNVLILTAQIKIILNNNVGYYSLLSSMQQKQN